MTDKKNSTFGNRFLWGASTAAHQVEGGTQNQWTRWELENAKSLATRSSYQFGDMEIWDEIKAEAKNPHNYVSGKSTDHYNRYEEDFDILKSLHLNAFRFSVEWSRIEPKEGSWDAEAIDYYKTYVEALKKRGIEPMVTLFHFTLPSWFADFGGFEKRSNVKYFVRFAKKILSELGPRIRYVITINEPEVYAVESYYQGNWPPNQQNKIKTFRVLNNLIHAHNSCAKAIKTINQRYKVSIAKNSAYIYPGDDALLSRFSARVMQYAQDDYVLKRVAKRCDFLGVNYYFSNRVYGYRFHNPDEKLSDLGWDMQPENLEFVLERLHKKYKLPLIVTENGVADRNDKVRKWWLGKTMLALQNARNEGVDVRGYLHWSLLDNFEWDKGKWPRFGLVEVDYANLSRHIRPSSVWWSKIIANVQKGSR